LDEIQIFGGKMTIASWLVALKQGRSQGAKELIAPPTLQTAIT